MAQIRSATRAKYHYAVRKVKRDQERIVANKMAESLYECKPTHFCDHVKKVRESKNVIPNNVDNITGFKSISDLFAGKYNDLYNSGSNTVGDCSSMKTQLNNICSVDCSCGGKCKAQHTITVGDIDKDINVLHNNKRNGTCDMFSDHLINGTPNLNVHLSLLFTGMLRHDFSPSQFCMSKLIPIPKSRKKSLNDSSNYRAIAMSNILGKLLDKVILANHNMALKSSDLQLGFKSESSTTACTFVLDEVVNYYNRNGSDVHDVLLDASKAFDRVDHIKLPYLLYLLVKVYVLN